MGGRASKDATISTCLLDLPDHIIVENILAELVPHSLSCDEPKVKDLRDVLSAASTCTRIHTLASHPSLWRRVNALVFCRRSADAIARGVAPPPLPLGAVHCGVFRVGYFAPFTEAVAVPMEMFRDITFVQIDSADIAGVASVRDRIVGAVSSLPRLNRLEIGSAPLSFFAGAKLSSSPSIESLRVDGLSGNIVGFLSASPFPSLTSLRVTVHTDRDVSDVVRAVVQSCPALAEVCLCGRMNGVDVAALAKGCKSLRKITINSDAELDGAAPLPSFPDVHELVIIHANRAAGGFLSVFPNLVRLEMVGRLEESEDDLKAIGGMMDLEHLVLDGGSFVDDSSRQLLPLLNHQMASGRRSLKSLELWHFLGDVGDFLSSPWCSHLSDLTFVNCVLTDSALEKFVTAHGTTLASTLRRLAIEPLEVRGDVFGRFVAGLLSLRELVVSVFEVDFDVNGLIREMGRGCIRLSHLQLVVSRDGGRINVAPLLPVISEAAVVLLCGNVVQADIDSIAESCRQLRRLTVTIRSDLIARPKSLVSSCKFKHRK